jgi:hypothetical protein
VVSDTVNALHQAYVSAAAAPSIGAFFKTGIPIVTGLSSAFSFAFAII